jgi:hypothetical protein
MKVSSKHIGILTVLGLAVLASSPVLFDYPLFGWVILSVMTAVFVAGQEKYRRTLNQIEAEARALSTFVLNKSIPALGDSGTIVAERTNLVREMQKSGQAVSLQALSDIMSARESARSGRSAGGVVILLGLIGTFYGLMLVIAQASAGISDGESREIAAMIKEIFSNMTGIFGTTLCGLFTALILNFSWATLSNVQLSFMADIEEYTQAVLLPALKQKEDGAEVSPLQSLEYKLDELIQVLATAQAEESTRARQEFRESMGQLVSGFKEAMEQGHKSLETLVRSASESFKSESLHASSELNSGLNHLISDFKSSLESGHQSLETLVQGVSATLAEQSARAVNSAVAGLESKMQELYSAAAKAQTAQVQINTESQMNFVTELKIQFEKLAQAAQLSLESQTQLESSVGTRLLTQAETLGELGSQVSEAGELMRVNQAELQSILEMFNQGVETLVDNLSGKSGERDDQNAFLDKLEATLEGFHEKATEVLVDNAMRTQEILLEVLNQIDQSRLKADKGEV